MQARDISRRAFMGASASAAFAFSIVDSKVLGADAPSNKLNLAIIGAGGQGGYAFPSSLPRPTATPPVPYTLDWKVWLGPVKERPYHRYVLGGRRR